eukprot:SAG31_NODE_7937_length_1560_cov_1.735797_2_plen_105_part_00
MAADAVGLGQMTAPAPAAGALQTTKPEPAAQSGSGVGLPIAPVAAADTAKIEVKLDADHLMRNATTGTRGALTEEKQPVRSADEHAPCHYLSIVQQKKNEAGRW